VTQAGGATARQAGEQCAEREEEDARGVVERNGVRVMEEERGGVRCKAALSQPVEEEEASVCVAGCASVSRRRAAA